MAACRSLARSARALPPEPRPPLPALLLGLVALSGAASLTYELLWIRALGRYFGTSTPAISSVVATFMGGLGVGYVWFGARADKSRRPVRLYQRLELCIAVTGFAVSMFLLRGGGWLSALSRLCAAAGPFSTACTVVVLALVMLVPTTAMGGTVPVLTSALARDAQPARVLTLLYASNTLGAIAGALGPDFVLIPRYGMTPTACVAAAANLTTAVAVERYARRELARNLRSLNGQARQAEAGAPHALELAPVWRELGVPRVSPQRLGALLLSASSGFCALGLEVLWGRTLQHWAAALVTSFAVLLAVYLAALALAALAVEPVVARASRPLSAAGVLTSMTGLAIILLLWAAPGWRGLARALWPRPQGVRRVGLGHEAVDALLHAGFLELAPCLLMGAAFPFIAAAWLSDGKAGARSGQLFVVNTLAGTSGALVVGFWWLPQLGEQGSYCALAWVLACVAALCPFLEERAPGRRVAAISGALGLACTLALSLALPRSQLFRAHFRSGGQVLAVEEGATTTAAAAARFMYGEPYYMELLTPGTSMSSTRGDARRYMSVMAHAAMFASAHPERALLICYGVGNTAHALLAHPSLKRLDVVDTSAEVLALSPRFAAARGSDPLRDPRTHVFVDDGRHHLVTDDARYDVITAEPPPPNHAAVANLYSREFYRLARSRLTPGGVITQWLPVFQLSDADVRAMIAAFVAELPYTALLYGCEQQLILIGSNKPIRLLAAASEALIRDMRSSYIGGVEDVLGSVIQTDAELRRLVRGVQPLSDERPVIQYPRDAVPEGSFFTSTLTLGDTRALSWLASDAGSGLRQRTLRASAATARALAALPLRELTPPEVRELALGRLLTPVLAENPNDQGLWYLLSIDSDRARLAHRARRGPFAAELISRRESQITAADRPRYLVLQDALWMLARRAFYVRDYEHALGLFELLHPERGAQARRWLFVAGCLRALHRVEASAQAFVAAGAASRDPSFRAACNALAAQAQRPFEPVAGPWSISD